ncbi:MAG: hypothetical protein M3447_09165, partial [Acidobacteriota bacterium]|nr:hypothetical protein [Acidobacteriota bacterium]
MKPTTRSPLTWITSLALVFSLCCGIMITDNAHAASNGNGPDEGNRPEKHQKLAQDLREKARDNETLKVILQLNDSMSGELNALLNSNGVKIKKRLAALNTLALELPSSVVESLNQFEEIEFVSVDSEIRSFGGHVAHTSGADNVRTMATTGALDGSGIGIAIVDSGIYPSHVAFLEAGTTRNR